MQVCSADWRAFQASLLETRQAGLVRPPESLTVTMESLFFPGELDAELALGNASAVVELRPGLAGCQARPPGQEDYAVAVAETNERAEVRVQVWCAPRMASAPVYRQGGGGFGPVTVPGALLDLQFGDDTGGWLAALAQLPDGQAVFLLNATGAFQAPALVLPGENVLLRIENLWLVEGFVLVDVLTRRLASYVDPVTGKQSAESASVALHFTLLPPLTGGSRWAPTAVDLLQFGRGEYWHTRPAGWEEHLFLPRVQGALPFRVHLGSAGSALASLRRTALAPASLPDLEGTVLSPVGQTAGRVFATAKTGWDWLRQVRLSTSGFVEGVYGSTGVDYTVDIQGTCDERGCEGCPGLQAQRLCQAYSRCALVNCVGTPVHQRRPLCGLGGLLRQTGRMGLLSTQGAWAVFTEMLTLSLRLSLLSVKEAYLLWPEDAFLCYVCQAKDSSAVFFSILTSTINSALQLGRADIGYMYGGASNVDTNADAVLTISSTALNAFMHQLALYPLYGLAVMHQIMMCQVSGVIALAPTKDFRLTIRGALDTPAGDLIAGQCLTVAAEVLASYPQDDPASLGLMVTSIVSNALQRLLLIQIEPFVHMLDGFLAYLIGVVKAMGTLILSQNMARCNPPDFFLQDVVGCACGDHALRIPAGQRQAGLAERAHWCTGVLGMIDSNNQPYYVYNKYSYAELQAKSAGMANYTACVSTSARGYRCAPPSEPFFANQGVTTLNVLIKCRENYVKKRWDPAAHMLYQPAFWDLVHFQGAGVPELPAAPERCLTEGDASTGSLAQRCLEEFLLDGGVSPEAYWAYERGTTALGPEFTDGCLVFSGPAEAGRPLFTACVDGSANGSACSLPQHLWTPRSSNDVPLAAQHRVVSHGVNRDGLVQSLYAQARELVLSAVAASLRVWNASGANPDVVAEFFSVEGDVLHQTMDCIFMGPYSRVDYWPTPECVAGEECLRGPFWARDEGEGAGRGVDPGTCAAPPSLPYTCGSPGRKSLMRYLVRKMLASGGTPANQNASNVAVILRATLQDLAGLWGDTAGFGCECAAGGLSPLCCAANLSSPLLPPRLNQTFTSISARTVLAALEDDMADLYRLALERREAWLLYLEDVSDNETAAYNWSGSLRATEEARLHPGRPASTYDEPLSPLLEEDSTLWDVCHAALKQVFFTLPAGPDGQVLFDASEAFDGDPARLQEFVRRFTAAAFERSPLFRHYSPRHAPSESQMCAQPADEGLSGEPGAVGYAPFVQAGATLLVAADLPGDGPAYHPQRFRVGAQGCLCGWRREGQRCYPPARRNTYNLVCQATGGCAADNSYALADEAAVRAKFSPAWHCPETELSPHWGYLDPSANERWLALNQTAGLVTSSRDLFRHGRAGLRPGNAAGLPELAKAYVSPALREVPLERGRLTTCNPPPPPGDLVQPFLDELFPAQHGVDEAGAVAYCLRYAIELARQEALALLLAAGYPAGLQLDEGFLRLQEELLAQRERAEGWRRRCGAQMHLLHLCASLRVFQPLLDGASRDPIACPHFRVDPATVGARAVYTTPQCLTSVDGVFYDPCRCVPCQGNPNALISLAAVLQCALRFDPRALLREGAPVGWTDGRHPLPDPEAALLRPTWAADLLADPDAAGNVEGDARWWQAEGPMAGNSEFCDTVLDWWPEAWEFPVGYHVTVPCEASETAYRSFAQAFGLDEAGNALVYQHDLLRDAALVDSHFGAAGLCRATTFGMPMPETNNMRYCTQMPLDDTEDFTLPVALGADPADGAGWTEWKCTASSAQLPWPSTAAVQGAHQSSRYSIGTIPNMPPETAATYPATDADMFEMGPVHEIVAAGNGWGRDGASLCQDYALRSCSDDAGCALDAATRYRCRGRACTLDLSVACTGDAGCAGLGVCRGVCIDPVVECIKHSDCPGERMCSGLGTCETPVLAVQNRLAEENMTLGLAAHGGDCGGTGRNFSLLQASYWGNTGKDVLRAHGMCSFEDWFKYTAAYSRAGCSRDAGDGTLLVDTGACAFVDLGLPSTNQTKWWPPGNLRPEIMYVRPTVCDRDYERLKGFAQCAPTAGTMLYTDGRLKGTALQFDQFVRLTDASRGVRLARMPELNNTRVGFLGMGGALGSLDELGRQPFVACGTIGQCYPARFTLDGATAFRAVPTAGGGWANYSSRDAFTCGVFGVQVAAGCALDPTRFPLYAHLCLNPAACPAVDADTRNAISRACTSIPRTYQASYQDRTAVLDGLRALFYVFPQFQTLEQYLQVTGCAAELYATIDAAARASGGLVSRSLYYPFMFALQELPFDWFYQCVVMSGLRVDPASHAEQSCQAYATRAEHRVDDYRSFSSAGDSFQTYLQYLRGGYLAADVARYLGEQRALASAALDAAAAGLAREMFGGAQDLSFPRCSSNLLWRIGDYGAAYKTDSFIPEARAMIWNRYDEQTCSLQWYEKLKGKLDAVGIPSATWVEALTEPDPLQLVPQDGAGGTSLLKEAARFMRAGMGLETLPLVTSQSTGCLRYNNQPPGAYDHEASPLPASLVPSPSVSQGTDVMDDSVPRTCAFLPAFDPAFADLGALACTREARDMGGGRVDRVQTCNGVECTAVPVYYRRNGKFSCRYAAEAVLGPYCTEASLGCEVGAMDAVYDALLRRYTANSSSLPPVLRPAALPWFGETGRWGFGGLDLSEALDYMGNIQPNQERAIMCEITTSADEATRFTTCNNPHYLALQRHARAHYKHDGAVLVPAGAQLEWPLQRSLLARGVMLSYASTNRSIRKRFLDALFDDETVCKGEPAEHVCRRRANDTRFQTLNPWLLGHFNPYEVCDVDFTSAGQGSREYISAFCLEQGNALCPSFRALSPAGCLDKNRRLVQQVGVPRAAAGAQYNDYNLCHHAVEEDDDGCMHNQGLLGGYDGLPVAAPADSSFSMIYGTKYDGRETYTVARNLYEESEWSIPDDYANGPYAGTNPLWQGDPAPYGYLRVDEDEIGGHRIGLAIVRVDNGTFSTMRVEKLGLALDEDQRFLDEAGVASRPTAEWVPGLRGAMAREDAAVRGLYGVGLDVRDLGASCPLQRWAFYSGGFAGFSPAIPAAKRARHLFHRVHGGLHAHPVMRTGAPGRFLGQYRSANGFCACPVLADIPQVQCRVAVADSASPCSLRRTIATLLAKDPAAFTESTVFPALNNEKATRRCEMMLDWPRVDGQLRDNSTVLGQWARASGPSERTCHILDRFRPFRYRYAAAGALAPSGRNTVRDGACATARVVSLPATIATAGYARCLRVGLSGAAATFACNTTAETFTLPRRGRLGLPALLARRARRRTLCGQCAPPPAFRSQEGRPLPPESSFGRLHRASPERLLAKDLRDAVCPAAGPCPLLNASGWRPGEFMRNYMLHPERLFLNRSVPAPSPAKQIPPLDADWTGRPWVYCPTAGALRTGEGCRGTMTRAAWTAGRATLCPNMVRSYSALNGSADPMARTPFCAIDNTTDRVCKAVATARQLVVQANCIARGDEACMPSPFVYHPASYEPSNNAWVHDSVKAFYARADPAACPASTQTDGQLAAFARAYQRSCPANGVNVFVGVLQAVRTVATDVALLLTTMISMAFNTLQLFVTTGREQARAQIGKNWAYIRSKARASLDAMGDVLVNALLNSGEAGARIMAFLRQSCDGLNRAADWFLNVWCNYIQKYTLQYLAGMRKFLGITGAGFDILQDFMDEVFQGILPAAFVQKYASGAFQNALIERYSQPSEKKRDNAGNGQQIKVKVNGKDVVAVLNDIPDSANPREVSKTAEQKGFLSRVFGSAGRAVRGIAKSAGLAALGLGLFEIIQGIMSAEQEERLRALYPQNFTLFDLTDIMNVVDDMEDFILSPLSQQTCASFQLMQKAQPGRAVFTCLKVDMDSYTTGTAAGTTSLDATMCWANAVPSVGQNSMFSCSGASTCCRTAECTDFILCASCAEPALPGVSKYGCDSLRQKCVCSITAATHSRCAANRQCDAASECDLVSSLNGASYGTIPCGNCPNTARLMCLLPATGVMPARCACMLAGGPALDLCNDRSGLRTPVDSSRLCGYLHNRRAEQDSWAFDMDDLIMLPCAQVSAGVCSAVARGGGLEPLRMVVAESVRAGPGRRLLSEEGPAEHYQEEEEAALDPDARRALLLAPGWEGAAAPCSTLALAYQKGEALGLLETHVLHTCAFWRHVGRRVIERYGLGETLGQHHETFLVSTEDLVSAAMAPGVGLALLRNLGLFATAALHHPWMRPVRALGVAVANHLEYLHWVREVDADVHEALFGELTPEEEARQALGRMRARIEERARPARNGGGQRRLLAAQDVLKKQGRRLLAAQDVLKKQGRRLLAVQDVLSYSARVIQSPGAALGVLPARVYGAWSTAEFAWPPRYNYSLEACPFAASALDIATHVARVNQLYYANFAAPRKPAAKTLRGNLPSWAWVPAEAPPERAGSSWASAAFRWGLGLVGARPEHLVAFFRSERDWSLTWILVSLTQCDLASTLTCSRHERDAFLSTLVFALLYLMILTVTQVLGVGFLSTLFLLSYPWFILWYAYGMAPTCAPLVPTCLMADALDVAEALLPERIQFPPPSLRCAGTNASGCLRPCADLGFVYWVDPLAYAVCDADDGLCGLLLGLGPTGVALLDDNLWGPARAAMARFRPVLLAQGQDLAGHRVCAWVSFVSVIPVLAMLLSATAVLVGLVLAALDLLPTLVMLVCQAVVFYET